MSTEVQDPPEQTAAALLSGILGDLQHLVEQQFELTKREIEEELRMRAAAAMAFGLGLGVMFLDAIVLCAMLAHLIHWLASPTGTDPAAIPLWACYGAVAAVLVVIGGCLTLVGWARFRSATPIQNPMTEIMEEHLP